MIFKKGEQQRYQDWKDKNPDSYGYACFVWAEAWSELMEKEIDKGAKIADIASRTSHESGDGEGYTGFMYNMTIQILGECWAYGDELREWHNLDVQLGDEGEKANEEGGYLNSAILHIGSK